MYYTGLPLVDDMFGGSVPPGILFIEGRPGSGTTALGLSVLREHTLRNHREVVLVDASTDTTPPHLHEYTGAMGVHLTPWSGEAALDAAYQSLNQGAKVVMIDTLDAIIPSSERNTRVGYQVKHAEQRLIYHGLQQLAPAFKLADALLVVTAGVRHDIQANKVRSYYAPKLLRGLFGSYLSLRTTGSRSQYGVVVWKDIVVGYKLTGGLNVLKEVKTRLYQKGLSRSYGLLQALLAQGIITRSGSTYKTPYGESFRSLKQICAHLDDHYPQWYELLHN